VHRLRFGASVRRGIGAESESTGEEGTGNRLPGGEREGLRGEERHEGIPGGSASVGPFGLSGGIKPPKSRVTFRRRLTAREDAGAETNP